MCRRSLNLLAHPKAHREDAQTERFQAFEQLAREQRQLLGPGRGGDVDGEHAPREPARLGAARHAIPDQPAPGVSIHRYAAALGRDDARAVQ